MPMQKNEEHLWICSFCGFEFDIEDPEIRVILPPDKYHKALIMVEDKPHSLVRMTWATYKAKLDAENHGLSKAQVYATAKRDTSDQVS